MTKFALYITELLTAKNQMKPSDVMFFGYNKMQLIYKEYLTTA